jgi:photosystem II stability/assembly factor-like uncharacterized protein
MFRTRSILIVLAVFAAINTPIVWSSDAAPTVDAQKRFDVPMDRDGDGRMGEESAIRQRVDAYMERHSVDGELTGRHMLARARAAYDDWLTSYQKGGSKLATDSWVSLGPINGAGRAAGIAPHPTDTGVLLQGSASGGVWKTLDGGLTWYPTTDGLPDLAVGAVAWAPSNPDIAYAGTGEGDLLIAGGTGYIPGIGLLRSDDAGETWVIPDNADEPYADLFFHIDVDPADPNTLLAATEKGVIRTTDGGASWTTVLSSSAGTSYAYVEVARSKQDPNLLYAAQWCEFSCPAGTDRVMKSVDRGLNWLPTANVGLPGLDGYVNRPGFAMAPSDDQILYISMNTDEGTDTQAPTSAIFRSDDGGESWTATADPTPYFGFQAWYDNTITVHPTDPDIVVAGGVYYVRTEDGGTSWTVRNPYRSGGGMGTATLPHVDAHDLQWQGTTLWLACDGGVWFSEDNGQTWTGRNEGVVTRQYYGIAVDPINRQVILGGTQDNGTDRRRMADDDTFDTVLGGDGFECAINPMIPDIQFATIYNTAVYRIMPPSTSFSFISPQFTENAPFITPLTLHPTRPQTVFTGTTMLWRSDNNGNSWFSLPYDTFNDVTNGVWSTTTLVWAIAVSLTEPDRIAVSKGGTLMNSTDGGRTWIMAIMPRTAVTVDISPHDPNLVLAGLTASTSGASGVMRSTDGGRFFLPSGSGLPTHNVQSIKFHPTDPNVAFAGTDVGLYRSDDAGLTWNRVEGLPAVSVHDIKILPDGSLLRVGTYGRGIWELVMDTPANTPPVIDITNPSITIASVTTGQPLDFEAIATDADGDPITVTWFDSITYETQAASQGTGTVTSVLDRVLERGGNYQIAAMATDSNGAQAVDYVTVLAQETANICSTPRAIPSAGPFPAEVMTSNAFAARGETDPEVPCIDLGSSDPDAGRNSSLWFEFTPDQSATYSFSTCGSEADTIMSVWTGPSCGPYALVAGGCNDDDENAHCFGQRTDSYLELDLEAGTTYRIMVGSWTSLQGNTFAGFVNFQVDCLDCGIDVPTEEQVIPAVSRADGLEGTTWLTDAVVYNPTGTDAEVTMEFLPQANAIDAPGSVSATVPAGQSLMIEDLVASRFFYEGSGAVRITGPEGFQASSRTFNTAATGTFGQFIPAVPMTHAIQPGETVRLIGLAENGAFRTNIGFANPDDSNASATIDLMGPDGTMLNQRQESFLANSWKQFTRIFNGLQGSGLEAATAVITNTSATAPLFVYASIVDASTGDPTYVTPVSDAMPGEPVWVAASAHATGAGSSVWRTDLELANGADVAVTVTIELMRRGQNNATPTSTTVQIPAASSVKLADVLDGSFGFTGAAALRLSVSDGPVAVVSRTFNLADTGTFGQFIPGVPGTAAAVQGEEATLIQLTQNDAFRTNIGLVNTTGSNLRVDAAYHAADGTLLATKAYDLPPFGYTQDGSAFGSAEFEGGFAILTTSTSGGAFLAYASVVDNFSDDPIYIPATVAD